MSSGGCLASALLVSFLLAAPAHGAPKVGVGSTIDALGGLRAPLEAQGWRLTTDRSSTIAPGDIYDPVDHQVQVLGESCFAVDRARTGVAPSMALDRALTAKGRVRFGMWGASASASGHIDARISGAEVAEIAVADLRPNETCIRQLQALGKFGADLASWYVVQSTLVTDLEIEACAAGESEVEVGAAGVSVGAETCRATGGTSVVLAIRPEPLVSVLAAVGIVVPSSGLPLKVPRRSRAGKGPPCWLDGPCLPYLEPTFAIAVGRGSTMGAADNVARATLLEPYERQRAALQQQLPDVAPPELVAAESVVVADRYSDGVSYFSLLVLDRSSLQARLDEQVLLAKAALSLTEDDGPRDAVPRDTVARAQALARSLPFAEQLVWAGAELAALGGGEASADPVLERIERVDQAVTAVRIRPPAGADSVATALERAGLTVGGADAALSLSVDLAPPGVRDIQSFTTVTRAGVVELRAADRLLGSVDVEASASSGDGQRATAQAEAALWDQVGERAVQLVMEALQ